MKSFFRRINTVVVRFSARLLAVFGRIRSSWIRGLNVRSGLVLVCLAAFGYGVYSYAIIPPTNFPVDTIVTISAGSSLKSIAAELHAQHVIRSDLALRIAVDFLGSDKGVFAGDYEFHRALNVFQVTRLITTGTFGLIPVKVRIVEGSAVRDMAPVFAAALPRFAPDGFLQKALPLEGYLYPDTYFFLPNATEDAVIASMQQNFTDHLKGLAPAIATSTRTFADIVTMASLLEKEAKSSDDRHKIAGVLWNRIDKGMMLQVDASFRYINGKGTFDLTYADLAHASLYNTYKYKGLPPGPIDSPSLDSIDAALHPIPSKNLFYLADKNGVTHYSVTYAEHLRKKKYYLGR